MVDNTVDYTTNSFNKNPAHDKRYNLYNPLAPYNDNFVLTNTPDMNAADLSQIMGRMGDINNPNNLLNDPILNRARANDPTVNMAVINNPMIFPPQPTPLIDRDPQVPENNGNLPTRQDSFLLVEEGKGIRKPSDFTENFSTNNSNETDRFWINDPGVLFRNGNYYRILPKRGMTRVQILNALTRFFIYFAILSLLFAPSEYLYIPAIAIIVIIFIYFINTNDNQRTSENMVENIGLCDGMVCNPSGSCQLPTKGNPFMNVTMQDWMDDRTRPPACDPTNPDVSERINEYFNYNLFKNVEDVFDRGYSQRQFYTTPSTTIPNDQGSFARWLYELPKTCKEDQTACLKYEDIRYSRFNPTIDRLIPTQNSTLP